MPSVVRRLLVGLFFSGAVAATLAAPDAAFGAPLAPRVTTNTLLLDTDWAGEPWPSIRFTTPIPIDAVSITITASQLSGTGSLKYGVATPVITLYGSLEGTNAPPSTAVITDLGDLQSSFNKVQSVFVDPSTHGDLGGARYHFRVTAQSPRPHMETIPAPGGF